MITRITYGTFIFFGSCTVVAFLSAYFFVPETKCIALEDMDILFGNGAPGLARAARKRYDEAHAAGINTITIREVDGKDVMERQDRVTGFDV
ncbi:hypothetical protein BDV96DRAFT_563752 [Lophiotrema nucula]|uniref:Major facilitator superfamily (MFS) profile domain-containing protein n=1 Tax=Lophiotrema nucula TaxID=690887 RepID=A0A6A5ZSG9_9PLEO|nr:hypothetical protein BDV96DRAFT_563752 [Lophiotrema nucula]